MARASASTHNGLAVKALLLWLTAQLLAIPLSAGKIEIAIDVEFAEFGTPFVLPFCHYYTSSIYCKHTVACLGSAACISRRYYRLYTSILFVSVRSRRLHARGSSVSGQSLWSVAKLFLFCWLALLFTVVFVCGACFAGDAVRPDVCAQLLLLLPI